MLSSLLLPLSRWVPTATPAASTPNLPASPSTSSLNLAHRDVLALPQNPADRRAQHIVCDRGRVWITVDGWPQDVVLEAGQCFVAPAHHRTVVYALSASQVRVRSGAAVSAPQPCAQATQPAPWPGRLSPAIRFWSALKALGI